MQWSCLDEVRMHMCLLFTKLVDSGKISISYILSLIDWSENVVRKFPRPSETRNGFFAWRESVSSIQVYETTLLRILINKENLISYRLSGLRLGKCFCTVISHSLVCTCNLTYWIQNSWYFIYFCENTVLCSFPSTDPYFQLRAESNA